MAMNKDKKKILIVVIAVALLLLIVQPGGIMSTSENIKKLIGGGSSTNANLGNPNVDFLSVRLYDADGNLIKSPETFSTVTVGGVTTKGVAYMDYTVMVDNSKAASQKDLTCKLTSVTPVGVFGADGNCGPGSSTTMVANDLNIVAGSKATWTSARMAVPGTGACNLENLAQPIVITATVACSYCDGGTCGLTAGLNTPQVGTFTLTVTAAGTAYYEVTVSTGGIPTEFCGDGKCQSPLENSGTCTADCSPVGKAVFRTSDLSYVSGSAIAWNGVTSGTTCPETAMTRYGYVSTTCSGKSDATCPTTIAGYTLQTFTGMTGGNNIKGTPSWATGNGCLYNINATAKAVLFKQTAPSSGPCASAGQWGTILYDSSDGDNNKVDSGYSGFDFAKEVSCTS